MHSWINLTGYGRRLGPLLTNLFGLGAHVKFLSQNSDFFPRIPKQGPFFFFFFKERASGLIKYPPSGPSHKFNFMALHCLSKSVWVIGASFSSLVS